MPALDGTNGVRSARRHPGRTPAGQDRCSRKVSGSVLGEHWPRRRNQPTVRPRALGRQTINQPHAPLPWNNRPTQHARSASDAQAAGPTTSDGGFPLTCACATQALGVLRRLQRTHRCTNHLQVTQIVVNGLLKTFDDQQWNRTPIQRESDPQPCPLGLHAHLNPRQTLQTQHKTSPSTPQCVS